jgi:hypothetical protein
MPSSSTTQIVITLTGGGGTVTIPIPQSPAGGVQITAGGFIQTIVKGGGVWTADGNTFYPASQIASITAS